MKNSITFGCAMALMSLTLATSPSHVAAQQSTSGVTVMTPDVVADYEPIRPDADFIKRAVECLWIF